MSDQRKDGIAWTDQTWNPLRGCSKVSAGCRNCYAETMAARFSGPGQPYEGTIERGRWNGQIRLVPERLSEPLHWKRPRRIFVNSMSDLFHEGVPFEYIAAVFGVMAACPQHTFQVLTKRPKRAVEFFRHDFGLEGARETAARAGEWHAKVIWDPRGPDRMAYGSAARNQSDADIARRRAWPGWPLPNVWLGVSVEDQNTADQRIPLLLQCPAAVRWVSYEPALAAVRWRDEWMARPGFGGNYSAARLDWIVIGGESGPSARPFDVAWARSTIAQCRAASVACFVKQLGSHPFIGLADMPGRATVDGPTERAWPVALDEIEHPLSPQNRAWRPKFKHHNGGNCDEWPEDLRVREWPQNAGMP